MEVLMIALGLGAFAAAAARWGADSRPGVGDTRATPPARWFPL